MLFGHVICSDGPTCYGTRYLFVIKYGLSWYQAAYPWDVSDDDVTEHHRALPRDLVCTSHGLQPWTSVGILFPLCHGAFCL